MKDLRLNLLDFPVIPGFGWLGLIMLDPSMVPLGPVITAVGFFVLGLGVHCGV
jgi:hypothetical protein